MSVKHPNTRIHIRNAQLVTGVELSYGRHSVLIEGDRIVAIDQELDQFEADYTLDAQDCLLMPAFVDLYSCLYSRSEQQCGHAFDPTLSTSNNSSHHLETETRAAASAGFGHMFYPQSPYSITAYPPQNTLIASYPLGSLLQLSPNGVRLSNHHSLQQAGCLGLTLDTPATTDLNILRHAFAYAATLGLLVISQPKDTALTGQGCAHEGEVASRLGLPAIPECAETIAIVQQLILAQQHNLKLHFTGISSARSLDWIRLARAQGQDVTADVSLAHLLFTDTKLEGFNSLYHTLPPLRSANDRTALLAAVRSGELMISSHHRPCTPAEKAHPFAVSTPGISLYDGFSAALCQLQREGISWPALVQALSTAPAKRIGIHSGAIAVGAPADLCLIDPNRFWQLDANHYHSQGRNNPWWQQSLQGQTVLTLYQGRIVHQLPL